MPFVSRAQRRKFYALYKAGKISKEKLEEWEAATGKKKLPERAARRRKRRKK